MLKRMVGVVAFAFITGVLAPVGSARAQTCCVCTECSEPPEQARCFADLDEAQCADFCAAQECNARVLLERACFSPLCEGFPYGSPPAQTAPALGSVGIALAGLAAALAGMVRLRRRQGRSAGR